MAEQVKAKRGNVIDAFVDGARNGLKIAFNSMLPNTLFGFTLTIILNLTGLADVIGVVFAHNFIIKFVLTAAILFIYCNIYRAQLYKLWQIFMGFVRRYLLHSQA